MKIRSVAANNRKRRLELRVYSGAMYPFPYAKLDPPPDRGNPIVEVQVDPELGKEAVTYILASGDEGSVHIDDALDYNQDPAYLCELLMHQLTVEAIQQVKRARLSRREVARRLKTSVPQLYRLLDPANSSKSLKQLVELLHVLGCDVKVEVKPAA